jgi:hypothetical protein
VVVRAAATAEGKEGRPVWKATLSNATAPVGVMVSDDGAHVVTFDNWGSLGYGADVLAFYDKTGQRRKYSFDQIVKGQGIEASSTARVELSVSSRWWRRDSVSFLDGEGQQTHVCLWLEWAGRWTAWDVATGDVVEGSPERVARWNARARGRMLKEAAADDYPITAIKFLGWLRNPEDRAVVAKLLGSRRFSGFHSMSDSRPDEFGTSSSVRETADAALARFDNKAKEARGRACVYLGSVHGAVRLPSLPKDAEPKVHLYLIPEQVEANGWASADPVHRLTIELGQELRSTVLKPKFDGERVEFRFETVTPGRYWVKAVYDAVAPYFEGAAADHVCVPAAGDFESDGRVVFEVAARQVARVDVVECRKPVAGK